MTADLTTAPHRGPLALLARPLLALCCSRRVPGDVILAAYDLALALRDAGIGTLGGFQTPLERELLRVLLRGRQPLVIVEPRGERTRALPAGWQPAVDAGRLLVCWPFPGVTHSTQRLARQRNTLVVAHAAALLVLHATPGGDAERMRQAARARELPVFALAPDGATSPDDDAIPLPPHRASWPASFTALLTADCDR